MTVLNRALTWLFDAIMGPLDRLPPMAGLSLLSLGTAVAVLLAFKWTADQRALVASKRAMQAALFEMRLFNDDLAALLRAQGEVLRHTLTYLRLSLAPTLWLMVPMAGADAAHGVPVWLHGADGWRGGAGQGSVGRSRRRRRDRLAGGGRRREVETPAVLLPSEREIAWRIRPRAAGSYELRVHLGAACSPKRWSCPTR